MPNRLIDAASPYLQQHARNPVNWYSWGAEALQAANANNKPIFLSIGYSACHWCHVMEHESFENAEIAAYLNEHFISIKVDREERPDLDQIYMLGVMSVSGGRGGWPLSAFLTPDQRFFYGGTYWPPKSRGGMPGFLEVLRRIQQVFTQQRQQTDQQATRLTEFIQQRLSGKLDTTQVLPADGDSEPLIDFASLAPDVKREKSTELLSEALNNLIHSCDWQWGGFGDAPKFPHAMDIRLLMQLERRIDHASKRKKEVTDGEFQAETLRSSVEVTLDRMAAGGIYDHIGGGFARYSVDGQWLVPHFEKMLYDNALLLQAYSDGFLRLNKPTYAEVVRQTVAYLQREMLHPAGGFYSSQDADSEGEEGKYYVWTTDEVKRLLPGDLGTRYCTALDITMNGNFEGKSIPNRRKSIGVSLKEMGLSDQDMDHATATLLAQRSNRIAPGTDYKVLTSWNALMIAALADCGYALGDLPMINLANNAANFIKRELRREDGRLWHSWRDLSISAPTDQVAKDSSACDDPSLKENHPQGIAQSAKPADSQRAYINAFLDDYAGMMVALLALHRTTWDESWLPWTLELGERVLNDFAAPDGGFYFTSCDHESLIARGRDLQDNSNPSGNSLAARAFWTLGRMTGQPRFVQAAQSAIDSAWTVTQRSPMGAGHLLATIDQTLGPAKEIILLLPEGDDVKSRWQRLLGKSYLPTELVLVRQLNPQGQVCGHRFDGLEAHFAGRGLVDNQPTLYVCENQTCQAPIVGDQAIQTALGLS